MKYIYIYTREYEDSLKRFEPDVETSIFFGRTQFYFSTWSPFKPIHFLQRHRIHQISPPLPAIFSFFLSSNFGSKLFRLSSVRDNIDFPRVRESYTSLRCYISYNVWTRTTFIVNYFQQVGIVVDNNIHTRARR